MTSVFAYRAPTDEDKTHLAALQEQFIVCGAALDADRERIGFDNEETHERRMFRGMLICLNEVLLEHVPAGQERDIALYKIRLCWEQATMNQYAMSMVFLRECRMWANAGIVLVR